jgi:O-antigen/teichoic acid export membrane protein
MRLISNIALMWMIRVVTLCSSALMSVVTARALGPVGRGLFALPAIDVSVAVSFSVGLSSAASYYLLNRRAGPKIVRALIAGFAVFALCGTCMTFVMAALSHSLWAMVPAIIYALSYAGYSIVCGYFLGRDRALVAGIVSGMLSLVTLIFVAVTIWKIPHSPSSAVGAWVTAIALVAFVGITYVLVDARKLDGEGVDALSFMRFGAKAGVLNVANLLNYRIDIFIVAMFLPVATVGLYTVAVTGAESALSLTLAIGQATLPRIGSLDRQQAGAFAARCLRNTLLFAAVLGGIGILLAPAIIALVFGRAYAPIVTPLRILFIGIVAASTTSIVSNYFVLNLGRTMIPLATSLLSTVICASVSIALIPRLGMSGAATASTVAYAVSQAVAIGLFCKKSGIGAVDVLFVDRRDIALYGRIARRVARIS